MAEEGRNDNEDLTTEKGSEPAGKLGPIGDVPA